MTGKIPARMAKFAAAMLALTVVLAVAASSAGATLTPIYNNIPKPLPGNTPSVGFEATSTSQFGGEIESVTESSTTTKVKVAMSSWACQSGNWNEHNCVTTPGAKFEHPVTLHIYAVGPANSVGTEVARLTQTFKMPYRPSDNPKCGAGGGWSTHCYHGKLFGITFSLRGVALPQPAIVSVSYNTSNYGANPTGCTGSCPEDSLNVGVEEGFEPPTPGATVGSQPLLAGAFLSSTWAGAYECGSDPLNVFRLDSCGWEGFQPLFTVETG